MKSGLYIFGDSAFSTTLARLVAADPRNELAGFVVDEPYFRVSSLLGLPVVTYESLLSQHQIASCSILCTIGYNDLELRESIFNRILNDGFATPSYIAPESHIHSSATIDMGNIIFPGVVIEPGVSLQKGNVVWSNATICHDSRIGGFNFFAANSTVGGMCRIGSKNFMGFSSVIEQQRDIGDGNVVGAMSFLREDILIGETWLGVPASQREC